MEFILFIIIVILIIVYLIKNQESKDEIARILQHNKMLVEQLDRKEENYKKEINDFKDKLENQKKLNKNFSNSINIDDFNNLKRDCVIKNKIINEKENMIDSLTQQIKFLKKENLENISKNLQKSNEKLEKRKIELKEEISELKQEIKLLKSEDLSLYTEKILFDTFNNLTSDELKNKLSLLKLEQKQFIQDDKAIKSVNANYTEKSVERNNKKQLLSYFEAECNNIFQNLKFNNIDKSRDKLIKIFNNLNNIFKTDDINLSDKFLDLKLKELNFLIEIAKKQQEEKETQKAIREQMIEEEKVRKEIEKEKLKIAKEEKQFNNEVSKMLSYLQKANNDIERQIYADKIKELEEKIKLLEKDKENVLQREANTRAGFVYIISNIGSFGEDVFKIGMTRRLEPMDRISELSSASVPFPFDVHALIFSDDAPSLENSLHKYFEDKSINKVNLRKEFFKIDINELKDYVLNNLGLSINFIDVPEAEQYRESLRIIEEIETHI